MTQQLMPHPGGRYAVGCVDGEFTYSREGNARAVGYRLFYPATEVCGQPVDYYPQGAIDAFKAAMPKHPLLPAIEALSDLKTHTYANAPAADAGWPIKPILYSHGFGTHPWHNLIQIEALVSRGYAVFAVQHPGDTIYCKVDGQIIGVDGQNANRVNEELVGEMLKTGKTDVALLETSDISAYVKNCPYVAARAALWADDLLAMLDETDRLNQSEGFALKGALDTACCGAFGFSLGGATSIDAALRNSRIKASVNLDGWQLGGHTLDHALQTQGLFVTKNAAHYGGNYGAHNPNIRCTAVDGASNMFFSDWCVLLEAQVRGFDRPTPTIGGREMAAALSDILLQFFDEALEPPDKES